MCSSSGRPFSIDPQTLIPLAIYVALAILAARPTAGRATWIALFAWAITNLVGGGILSVLPLGVFPFQPEQSLGHYGVHVVYAVAQVPLVVVAWSGLRALDASGRDAEPHRAPRPPMRRSVYDLLYRFGAPWDGPPRAELVRLVEDGFLTPARFPPGRALDLGCGTGANIRYLARHGFEATGVDFSQVALRIARRRAAAEAPELAVRFVEGDLTAREIPGVEGLFDLLIDYGTLDDLDPAGRLAMARLVADLARPGAVFLLWCFWARPADLPRFSLTGPSRMVPVISPGEEVTLFGDAFAIERLPGDDDLDRVAPAPGRDHRVHELDRAHDRTRIRRYYLRFWPRRAPLHPC